MNQAHEHTGDIDRGPRNIETLQQTALSYEYLGRFDEQKSMFDRVLAIVRTIRSPNRGSKKIVASLAPRIESNHE